VNQIPFDPYDFFGYLSAGLTVILGMQLTLGFPAVIGRDLKNFDLALILLAAYEAGQLIATPAKALIEDLFVGKILRRPSINLFSHKKPWIRSLLFPGWGCPFRCWN
jgi:hypothetical protein